MSVAGNYNANANPNNILFNTKNRKSYVRVVTLLAKDNQKLSKLLSKIFWRSIYRNERKKSEKKNTAFGYWYFLKSNFVGVNRLFVPVYSNQDTSSK